jgi:hypothetical protein
MPLDAFSNVSAMTVDAKPTMPFRKTFRRGQCFMFADEEGPARLQALGQLRKNMGLTLPREISEDNVATQNEVEAPSRQRGSHILAPQRHIRAQDGR